MTRREVILEVMRQMTQLFETGVRPQSGIMLSEFPCGLDRRFTMSDAGVAHDAWVEAMRIATHGAPLMHRELRPASN